MTDPPGTESATGIAVVIPTAGRDSLGRVLAALDGGGVDEIIVVADRGERPLVPAHVRVVPGNGGGPAVARNLGWRAARAEWIAFLDDDVVPGPGWAAELVEDLRVAGDVAGVQGVVSVPLPLDRAPTDNERRTAGLAAAKWITADIAYRRAALAAVGGFDERFPRAYREDVDLAIRLRRRGWRLVTGRRLVFHPVRPTPWWASLAVQCGNADDALLRRLYGPRWHTLGDVPPGRRPRHVAVTAAALAALALGLASRRPGRSGTALRAGAALAAAGWLAGTAEFAWARIAPGPRTPAEVAAMTVTSAAIPPLAVAHWLHGWLARRRRH